jgi:TPR repeat protein
MDDRSGAGPMALRVWALTMVGLGAGCAFLPRQVECPRGQQQHDGQCVPTSSLVFERCLESFRKTRVERERGTGTEVALQVKGQGGSLHHERKDLEQAEYDGLPEALMGEAIDECRRQEQDQRSLELERAWAAAEEAKASARQAEGARERAEQALQRAEREAAQRMQSDTARNAELEAARTALAEANAALAEERARLVERHPCTAEAWDRCGEQALMAKRDGDYAQAHALYRQACEGGSAQACSNWGVMFEHGLGVEVDLPQAASHYLEACEHGDTHGCVNLGFLHEEGRGAPRDLDHAAALYQPACEAGHMRGCGRLGRLLGTGAVVGHETLPPAAELLGRACDGDYPQACQWAGERELEGRDGERQPVSAARRFRRACEHDVPEACVALGRMHELGDGVSEDFGEATRLYQRACEAHEPRGCAAIERMSRGREAERNTEPIVRR